MIHMGIFKFENLSKESIEKIKEKEKDFGGIKLIGYIENEIIGSEVFDEESEFSAIVGEDGITITRSEWIILDRKEMNRFSFIESGEFIKREDPDVDFGIKAEELGELSGYSLPPDILGEDWLKQFDAKILKLSKHEERLKILKERFEGYNFENMGKRLEIC